MAKKKSPVEEPFKGASPQTPRPRLHKLKVSNSRCIGPEPVEIELDDIVVLVGPNNSGKSCILRAYQVVMEPARRKGTNNLRFPKRQGESLAFCHISDYSWEWVKNDYRIDER